jgi:4-diphosphocytidyl-2-C-methyl-D-erythritol kinase
MSAPLPLTWPAPAKLNLFLHVLGRRSDGYHRLQTVFQFIDLCDELSFTPRADGVIARPEGAEAVAVADDLVVHAALALKAATGHQGGVDIRVLKRIPMGAGLGGGSSDAATTLVALNRLWGTGLDADALAAIGLGLGADVPVFVRGHAAWGEGVGEALTPVTLAEPWFALIAPDAHVPTAEIFGAPELKRDQEPITLADFEHGRGVNDCAPVTCARYPAVAAALSWLGRAAPARMSGTGSAVFAQFADARAAHAALRGLPAQWQGFVARGLNVSPLALLR